MEKIKWLIFSATVIGFFAFVIIYSNQSKIDLSNINISVAQAASKDSGNIADHTIGNPESKVVLIEYADYQCPGCASINPIIKLLIDDYKDQIQYIFRNYPIPSIHNNAKSSAAAVEAAGLQGKYWEMHNKIFETQLEWQSLDATKRTDFYVNLAKSFDLNIDDFKKDMSSPEISAKIKFDQAMAQESKVTETPSFLLNEKLVDSDIWADDTKFRDFINEELKKFKITPPTIIE